LCLGSVWSSGAFAQTSATRSSSFAYDAASGPLTQEVVEPNTPALRLETDYANDAFGNKTSVTVSGVDIVIRSSTAAFESSCGAEIGETGERKPAWLDSRAAADSNHGRRHGRS
jgi:hypothetical protein